MTPTYVALDLETTGLDPERDRIIEVGATRFDATGAGARNALLRGEPRPRSPGLHRALHRRHQRNDRARAEARLHPAGARALRR